jgi:KTSC domain
MERTSVTSSNVASIGYDPTTQELHVGFKGKDGESVYSYAGVPKDVYDALMAADSKGGFLNSSIKGTYSHSKR